VAAPRQRPVATEQIHIVVQVGSLSPDLCRAALGFLLLCAVGKGSAPLGGPPPLAANKGSALSRRASGRASSAGVVHVRLSDSITKPLACITPSPKSAGKQTDQVSHSPHREVFGRMSIG
jgi:hypothetical protein